jgi:hypothetical protein
MPLFAGSRLVATTSSRRSAPAAWAKCSVVIEHPMDPGVVNRIDGLKASIPKGRLDGLVANANVLSPAAVMAMISPVVGEESGLLR